jgi:hypothetical protein
MDTSTGIKTPEQTYDPNMVFHYLTPQTVEALRVREQHREKSKLDFSVVKFFLWTPGNFFEIFYF